PFRLARCFGVNPARRSALSRRSVAWCEANWPTKAETKSVPSSSVSRIDFCLLPSPRPSSLDGCRLHFGPQLVDFFSGLLVFSRVDLGCRLADGHAGDVRGAMHDVGASHRHLMIEEKLVCAFHDPLLRCPDVLNTTMNAAPASCAMEIASWVAS